nr:putative holin-like toxin [Brevibacillus halotolerans]
MIAFGLLIIALLSFDKKK